MSVGQQPAQDKDRFVEGAGSGQGTSPGLRSFKKCHCHFLLLLLLIPSEASARYCNNPNCQMCLRIFGPMPGYETASYGTEFNGAGVGGSPLTSSLVASSTAPVAGPFSVYDPTPMAGVNIVVQQLRRLGLSKQHTLYDLGCGDARVMLEAQKASGCKAVGIELQKHVMQKAIARIKSEGSPPGLLVVNGDATKFDLSGADVIFIYLFPNLTAELVKKIPAATPIVSYSHPIPGRKTRKVVISGHTLYVSGDLQVRNFQPI